MKGAFDTELSMVSCLWALLMLHVSLSMPCRARRWGGRVISGDGSNGQVCWLGGDRGGKGGECAYRWPRATDSTHREQY